MGQPTTTMVVPPKVALSRHERFLQTACRACRACWGGIAIFIQDGLLREHVTDGLPETQTGKLRSTPSWIGYLRELATGANHKCGRHLGPKPHADGPPASSSIGVSWAMNGHARVVLYVVRSHGEPFGPAEEAALQALSLLLAQESQQDESHLIAKLRVLNQVAQAAASLRDLQELFALALLELERHIPSHCGAIWLCDDEQSSKPLDNADISRLRLAGVSDRAERLGLTKDKTLTVAGSMFLPCVQEGSASYVDARELEISSCDLARTLAREEASAAFAVPLRAGQRLLGILQCICTRPGGFTHEQIQLFYLVADLLGPAIAQALWLQRLLDANHELRATQVQLIQSEKIRALGEMASGMAHDFNNALCGVLGFLELTLLDTTLPPTCRTYLESSKTCALDAAQTVRRVQEFARRHRNEGELTSLDLDELVCQTVELTRHKWESLTQLDKPIAAEVLTRADRQVNGNASELREALTNLVFNAVDAMPQGGRLTIRTWAEDDSVFLAVQDSGIGIPDDARRRLFEPFFTTKGERGTGLGLSVTFGIIQRHGGEIAVESRLGEGSIFTIRLPVLDDVTACAADTDPEIVLPANGSQLLVVEDEERIRRFLSSGLTKLGYQLHTAPSAEEALSVLSSQRFDAVLTDLGLPGMSGAELAKNVQQRAPGTPVVLLTGRGEQIQAENQQIDGVVRILPKPVTINTLAKTLASICAVTDGL